MVRYGTSSRPMGDTVVVENDLLVYILANYIARLCTPRSIDVYHLHACQWRIQSQGMP